MCCIAGKDAKAAYSRANSNEEDSTFKSPDHYIATTNTEKTVRFQFQVSVSRLGVLSGKKDSCKIYVTVQQIPY
jgi:DNA-directed RNA polymerase alpha subunit